MEHFRTHLGILYCGDSTKILKSFPERKFKLILADYPFKVPGGRERYFNFLEETAREFTRLLADDGWLVVLNNPTNLFRLAPYLQELEFRNEVALVKPHKFCPPGMFCFKHNALWFLSRKKQKLNLAEKMPDVLDYRNGYRLGKRRHPEAIPEWLVELIITATTKEGDLILDPFAGSGTTLVVAERLNRRWVGVELQDKYCSLIRERFRVLVRETFK